MAPPVGLIIGGEKPRNPTWRIGKEAGKGACASVHFLENVDDSNRSSSCSFCIKVAPLPVKTTKKKTSIPERNVRLLNHEEAIYRNQLPDYQGYIIPKLPPFVGPPVSGEVDGKFMQLLTTK